jgi:cation:H+ antiporter
LAWWSIWIQFLICAAAIFFSGTRLSRYGDVLAEKTGVGRTWMGLLALAVITSLPELVTSTSAILWVKAADIAVGSLLGACVLNLAFLGLADLVYPSGPVLTAAGRGHVLAATFAVIILAVACLGLMARSPVAQLHLGHVGLSSPVIIICYLVAIHATYHFQKRERAKYRKEQKGTLLYADLTLKQATWKFAFHGLMVMAAAIWLPRVAKEAAQFLGWHLSLIGTVFVAAITTLPELVVTLSAMWLGAVDLAVGNLLGSVLVDAAMLGVMDLLYVGGPLLTAVAPGHVGTGLLAIVMTGIAMAEMMYRPEKKALRWMSLGAFLLVVLFGAHIFLQMVAKG